MSTVVNTGCLDPIFNVTKTPTAPCPALFLSAAQVVECPSGYSGGPFVSPQGKFTSTISQADADAQGLAYAQSLAAGNCIPDAATVQFTDSSLSPYGAVLSVALDGGAFEVVTFSGVHSPVYTFGFQLQYKLVLPPGTYPSTNPFSGLITSLSGNPLTTKTGSQLSVEGGTFFASPSEAGLIQNILDVAVIQVDFISTGTGPTNQSVDASGLTMFNTEWTLDLGVSADPFSVTGTATYLALIKV